MYGKDVDDSCRPSAQNTTEFDDEAVSSDKENRDILKAGKARDFLYCRNCEKPRVIYSASKMTREQVYICIKLM